MNFQLKIKETRENLAAKQTEYTTLLAGEMNDETRSKLDTLLTEINTLKEDEKRFAQALEIQQRTAAPVTFEADKGEEKEMGKMLKR